MPSSRSLAITRVRMSWSGMQHVEEVPGGLAVGRHHGQTQSQLGRGLRHQLEVGLEQPTPLRLDRLGLLELAGEVRRQRVGHAEGGARVAPRVLVDLAEEEGPPVGALLVEDARAVDVPRVVEQQRTALAAHEVLGLVEAQAGHPAQAAEGLAGPASEQRVRGVLDDGDVGPVLEHLAYAGDVARDAGVVHEHDGPHGVVEQLGEVLGVDAERARLDVAEQQPGSLPRERERARGEGERRHDHRVVRAEVHQHRAQLEGGGARRREQHLLRAGRGRDAARPRGPRRARHSRCARPRATRARSRAPCPPGQAR